MHLEEAQLRCKGRLKKVTIFKGWVNKNPIQNDALDENGAYTRCIDHPCQLKIPSTIDGARIHHKIYWHCHSPEVCKHGLAKFIASGYTIYWKFAWVYSRVPQRMSGIKCIGHLPKADSFSRIKDVRKALVRSVTARVDIVVFAVG
jgi:hypothetical protein